MNVRCDKRFFVSAERTQLAEMLWALKGAGEGLSLAKMAARSGGLVAVSTLHNVMTGKSKDLTPDTITGLSKILGVSEARVLAALSDRDMKREEVESEDKERLWEMYIDIPPQCQKDVMDLLEVLQRNHSVSKRKERIEERRREVAAAVEGGNVRQLPPAADRPPGAPETDPRLLPMIDYRDSHAQRKRGRDGKRKQG